MEDPLATVLQRVFLYNLPRIMWLEEAQALGQDSRSVMAILEACVIIDTTFDYPSQITLEVEGTADQSSREVSINVNYDTVNRFVGNAWVLVIGPLYADNRGEADNHHRGISSWHYPTLTMIGATHS